jgi:hypothetical protein
LTKRRWAKCGKHVKKPWWETNLHARYIKIKQKDGHLGPYPRILNPRDVQHMIFQGNDMGPFWLSERERDEQHHDKLGNHPMLVKTRKRVKYLCLFIFVIHASNSVQSRTKLYPCGLL